MSHAHNVYHALRLLRTNKGLKPEARESIMTPCEITEEAQHQNDFYHEMMEKLEKSAASYRQLKAEKDELLKAAKAALRVVEDELERRHRDEILYFPALSNQLRAAIEFALQSRISPNEVQNA